MQPETKLSGLRPAPVGGAIGGKRGPVQLGHQASGIQGTATRPHSTFASSHRKAGGVGSDRATTASALLTALHQL